MWTLIQTVGGWPLFYGLFIFWLGWILIEDEPHDERSPGSADLARTDRDSDFTRWETLPRIPPGCL